MREGWELKKLKEVCRFQNGFAFKSRTFRETGTPVVRITNIQAELVDLRKVVFIDRQDYDKDLSKYEIINGDLLIAMSGATTGKIGIHKSDEVLLLNQRVGKFEPLENLEKQYLFYFLSGKVEENLAISAGSAQPNLSTEQINNFEIPIPPLKEQKQIVALLDKAFTAIDQAKANIEKNIANAKELFQSKLNDIFSQKGAGWEEKTLKEVCILQRGFDLPKRLRKKGKYDLVTSSGVKDSHAEYKVNGPGVVTGRSGSIGKVFYVENKFWPLNTALYIKDFKDNNERYVYYFLKNFDLSKYSTGTGVPTLNRNFVHDEKVLSTKNVNVQKEIVRTLDELTIKSEMIESNYTKKLKDLEELKKSILQKAFAGELTNQSAVGSNEFAVNIE